MIDRAWQWLNGTPGSWVGHAVIGFVIAVVGDLVYNSMNPPTYAIFVHFLLREVEDFIYGDRSETSVRNGVLDFVFAFVGLAVYLAIRILT